MDRLRRRSSRSRRSTRHRLGCNFFDTAWAYGEGHSERLLGQHARDGTRRTPLRRDQGAAEELPVAGPRRDAHRDVFPPDHIREYTEKSLENLGARRIDLQQLHVWSDAWAEDEGWKRAVDDLKREKLIASFGISVNRWEPANVLRALESGLVDGVQVVYNIFDQAPEDELFPDCQAHGIAIIARVPFDEGSLTGTLPRRRDVAGGRLAEPLLHAGAQLRQTLRPRRAAASRSCPPGRRCPELALRFILHHPAVTTVIPGMRRPAHVGRTWRPATASRCRPVLGGAPSPPVGAGLAGAVRRAPGSSRFRRRKAVRGCSPGPGACR